MKKRIADFFKKEYHKFREKKWYSKAFDLLFAVLVVLLIVPSTRKEVLTYTSKVRMYLTSVEEKESGEALKGQETLVFKDSEGQKHRIGDYFDKPVFINYWATWCPPCRAEMPSMERAWKELADEDILLIGINVGEDADTVNGFIEQVPVSFPLPMDTDSKLTQTWPLLRGLPTTFVVDPDGRLVYLATGEREWDDPVLLDLVRALKR